MKKSQLKEIIKECLNETSFEKTFPSKGLIHYYDKKIGDESSWCGAGGRYGVKLTSNKNKVTCQKCLSAMKNPK